MSADDTMEPSAALKLLEAFAEAYNRHDVHGIMALMTHDCVFLSYFGSDVCGERFEGFEKSGNAWRQVSRTSRTRVGTISIIL